MRPDHPHDYVDRSRRKPYVCGVCGKDITHPMHQPALLEIPNQHTELVLDGGNFPVEHAPAPELQASLF